WNATQTALPASTLHELFEAQVRETPEATALIFEDVAISYRDLNERANRLAHHLVASGVRPEARVGLLLERSPEVIVGLLAIFKAGGAYLPLDPSYPPQRLAFMLEDAAPQVVLTTRELLEKLPTQTTQTICLDTDEHLISSRSGDNPSGSASAENLAYLIYTSGSTGQPKAVQVEHRQMVNTLAGGKLSFSFNPSDSMPVIASFSFDISLFELLTPLISGATARVLTKQQVLDMPRLLDTLREITLLHTVPSLMQQIIRSIEESESTERFDNLRAIFIGGEAVPPQLLQRMREVFPSCRIHVLYGPTEAAIICTSFAFEEELQTAQPLIGRPLSNVRIELRDKHGQLVPVGVRGEIYVGGAGVARGYRNRPELNAERFVTIEGERFYRTGDLARYRPDGNIEFLGRDDNQVKVRGYRIELSEVEVTISNHSLVREAIVVATDDATGNKSLVAYIVAERQTGGGDQHAAQATGNDGFAQPLPPVAEGEPERLIAQIREHLRASLPEHMMPAAFLVLDEIPLTPNGKIDRNALPLPERNFRRLERDYQPPRNPTEELLANIWAQSLGVERVGIHHNFFELGGHSLLATQIISRVRRALRVEVPLRALFESPTVAGLAQHVDALRRVEADLERMPILPVARGEKLPLSFAQQRLWFLDQLEQGSAAYNLPYAGRLAGALNLPALERSVAEIIQRHEALRTSFVEVDAQPVQLIALPAPFEIPLIDLSDLPEAEREAAAQQLVAEEAERPFDLSKSPLLRMRLIRMAEHEHILTLTIHHIISDGWSMGLFFGELGALYAAYTEDRESPLPELAIQYADFAEWQRRWLRGETLERQLAYWREQLAGAPATLELPTDRPRPPLQSYRGATESFALSQELSAKLDGFSRDESVTLFMTLLAAFKTLLSRYSGQKEIVVGTPIAGRNHAEIENLIGFFVNTLALRTSLCDNPTFRSLVRRVRDVALGAYAHQDTAFEKLVEDLQPERDLSRAPLFQVMFALQNAPGTAMEFSGLKLTPLEAPNRTAKFDLTLYLTTDSDSIKGSIEYNTDLFEAATIRRMISHFQRLLESSMANPEASIFDLPLLAEAEQRQLLVEWNETKQDYDRHACLHHLFEAQAARTPFKVALIFDNQQLTYAELNARANQLARHLHTLHVGVESCVAILMHRSLEMVVSLLAVLKAGAAYLPIDPELPDQRIAFMLSDAGAHLILTQEQFAATLAAYSLPVVVADAEGAVW
ncbi:MAG TPA: amino acid adenylation domain-containing protein, partial [Pyrinomonadaceae bacterium]|nr:amino acid adenylation domain-containing protein [Pyrinomonadaceae bacterium]